MVNVPPGGNPKLKAGTQELRTIVADYASLESDSSERLSEGKTKRGHEEDEGKTITITSLHKSHKYYVVSRVSRDPDSLHW